MSKDKKKNVAKKVNKVLKVKKLTKEETQKLKGGVCYIEQGGGKICTK